ncbi:MULTISPECIES: hydroxymethylbilane synthase [Clostridia]|uniref:hydroxymethylbilane synthase n=1 Tax=Clostridia TaxID=186801 RepID=UPI0024E25DD7|nr:hydroxymethylbilane synthase [Eubacterium sp. AF22-9]
MHYRIGTRGSKLALVQSEYVKRRMEEAYPEDTFELVIIKTTGDKVTDKPLAAIGTKGLFVKEIEEELLSGSIDMAVHSMKDMPAECATGLTFAKAWKREDCRDVLILKTAGSFSELPSGAVIGTGSLRRACQLAMLRPDIQFTAIRGNVDTRINKLMDDSYGLDGIVLAAAGLNRLGRSSEITEYLDPEVVIPAPAQGVLAIETAEVNTELLDKINALSDDNSDREAVAERTFLRLTGGGCHAPVGAHCVTKDNGDLEWLCYLVMMIAAGFLELKLQELTVRRLATKQPVCLDWSRLWVNTYIHILKTDRCTIKALPLQNYLQRRGFPAKK